MKHSKPLSVWVSFLRLLFFGCLLVDLHLQPPTTTNEFQEGRRISLLINHFAGNNILVSCKFCRGGGGPWEDKQPKRRESATILTSSSVSVTPTTCSYTDIEIKCQHIHHSEGVLAKEESAKSSSPVNILTLPFPPSVYRMVVSIATVALHSEEEVKDGGTTCTLNT